MLLTTTMQKKAIMPPNPILRVALENLNNFEVWVLLCAKILIARTYDNAMIIVAAIFTPKKAMRLVLSMDAITGLSSEAPENEIPITVVKQSANPIATSKKLGTICNLIMILSLLLSQSQVKRVSAFKNQISNLDILQKSKGIFLAFWPSCFSFDLIFSSLLKEDNTWCVQIFVLLLLVT
jgi:hypothetical protein